MKKSWIITGVAGFFLIIVGLLFFMRPAPQDLLVTGIMSYDLGKVETAMNRGADASLVIERGNSANISPGYTPFQLYLMESPRPEGVQLLMKKADLSVQSITGTMVEPDTRDTFVATPLHYLVHVSKGSPKRETKLEQMLKLLLDHGALVNAKSNYPRGLTPLMLAQREWVLQLLLEAGADPNMVAADNSCLMNYSGQEPTHPFWKLLKQHGGRPRRVPDSPSFPRVIWGTDPLTIEGWKYTKE